MQDFVFKVDSALLGELGEKLVSTVHVALAELVKNAYDADAAELLITITPDAAGRGPRITVTDDGHGMTREDVERYWMKIGTPNKVEREHSREFGRLLTGAKGVGRFACRRLGTKLRLTTCALLNPKEVEEEDAEPRYQKTQVDFNWLDFVPGTDVDSVANRGTSSTSKSGKPGTTLEIWDAESDEWTKRNYDFLFRQLGILSANTGARRKGFKPDPGFRLGYTAPEYSGREPRDLRDELIDATWGTLEAKVDSEGRAVCTLVANGIGAPRRYTSNPDYKRIKGASARIGILPLKDRNEYRNPSILTKMGAESIIDEWGGVQVRFNGFRMFPYGERGDDWLEIDADRGRRLGKPEGELLDFAQRFAHIDPSRALLNMLSSRNYVGSVNTTSQMGSLLPRMDRQGFVDNDSFQQLKRFVRLAVDWANIQRESLIRERAKASLDKAREELSFIIGKSISAEELEAQGAKYLRNVLENVQESAPKEQQEQIQFAFRTLRAISEAGKARQQQLEHLRLIASASTLTLLFAHELRTLSGSLAADKKRLLQLAEQLKGAQAEKLEKMANSIGASQERFARLIRMTGTVGAFERNPKLGQVSVDPAVSSTIECFDLLVENYGLTITQTVVPKNLCVHKMIEGEFYTIVINLLMNAVKSVIARGGRDRRIDITAQRDERMVEIVVRDTGLGLAEDFHEEVFKPFLADPEGKLYSALETHVNKQDALIFGTGTGMGLSIVRDITEARGGSVRFVTPEAPWKAQVTLRLPWQENQNS
jgi:signal transduction histidine kinase/anti-sigma regulatory factor (Ser/Thr protein kinase)